MSQPEWRRIPPDRRPDMNAYADAKTEVVESIIAAAIAENGPS